MDNGGKFTSNKDLKCIIPERGSRAHVVKKCPKNIKLPTKNALPFIAHDKYKKKKKGLSLN